MYFQTLLVSSFFILSSALNATTIDQKWHHFQHFIERFGKNYITLDEFEHRFDIFKDIVPEDKLVNIGWRTMDFSISTIEKEYDQYLLVYNDIYFNDIQKIINIWKLEYPTLNIVFNGTSNVNRKKKFSKHQLY